MRNLLIIIALLCLPSVVRSEEILSKDFYLLGDVTRPVITTKQEEKELTPVPQITIQAPTVCLPALPKLPQQSCEGECGSCCQHGQCCQPHTQLVAPPQQYRAATPTPPPSNGGPQWRYNAATGEYYRYVSAPAAMPTVTPQYQYTQPMVVPTQRYYQPQQYYYYSRPQQYYNYSTPVYNKAPMTVGGGGGGGCPT